MSKENNMLKLIKLELEGFGCFKEKTTFDYEDSINLIKAQNGSYGCIFKYTWG